jgi:hypothetical protein
MVATTPGLRPEAARGPACGSGPDARWREARERFLAAVDPGQREAVARRLRQRLLGGAGLRAWLRALVWTDAPPPARLPPALIDVYLRDPLALPLHDCAECGTAVPVRPGRRGDAEAEPERVYFPACPCCGGKTGLYAYWSGKRRAAGFGRH